MIFDTRLISETNFDLTTISVHILMIGIQLLIVKFEHEIVFQLNIKLDRSLVVKVYVGLEIVFLDDNNFCNI